MIKNGLRIDLEEPLPRGVIRSRSPPQSILFQEHIVSEVTSLLEKDAVERVRDHDRLCLSPVFVIPKRSGSLRMILNMKRINRHIAKSPFRMDHLASILPALGQDDFAVSLDLSDAYFHVPIDPSSRDLLGFAVGKETFRFKALPFGLRPAPRVFTRVVSALMSFLRGKGLRIFAYLDDWLLVANSEVYPAFTPSFDVSENDREFGIHDQLVQVGISSLPNSDLLGGPVRYQESTGSAEP